MIALINGSFGVGKSTVARQLVKCLPHSRLYDPEMVGFVIRRLYLPSRRPEDYQDLRAWRTVAVQAARAARLGGRNLVIPMSLWRPDYFAEIMGGLRRIDPDLHHFCLVASADTIYSRLLQRGVGPGSSTWQHVQGCVASLAAPGYEQHIQTDDKSPEEVAQTILARLSRPD